MKKDSLSLKDYFKTQKAFQLKWKESWQCYETFPKPDVKEISKYYDSKNYISHQKEAKIFKDKVYNWVRNHMLNTKTKWIKNEVGTSVNLLDFGCGVGEFVKRANQKGLIAEGIEPNYEARQIGIQNKQNIFADLSDINNKRFDVVTLWHVLEHLHEPDLFLKEIRNYLNKKGKLIIAVPNFESQDAKYYNQYWAAYDVPRHLYHFSKKSISILAEQNGFKINKTYPLKFDSYYVSMLSEKYKTGKIGFQWIWNGFLSNCKARKNKEWSSLVFVLDLV